MRSVYRYEPLRSLKDMIDMIFCGFVGYGIGIDKDWKYYLLIFLISWFLRFVLSKIENYL